jgi:hypothetical protein
MEHRWEQGLTTVISIRPICHPYGLARAAG